jgi:small subunit ribosomal protein S4
MGKYNGPKDRLSRREGFDLFGKGTRLTRLNVPPGVHGPKASAGGGRGRSYQYKKQLREKQKVKRFYGILEKQFRNYVKSALAKKGKTSDSLFALLESRLDNVIYRLGFASSRPQARQLVSHRHVLVNGKKLNIPSYQVKLGDTISLSPKALEIPTIQKLLKDKDTKLPGWLKRKAAIGKVEKLPTRDDVPEPFEDADVIEFYSR